MSYGVSEVTVGLAAGLLAVPALVADLQQPAVAQEAVTRPRGLRRAHQRRLPVLRRQQQCRVSWKFRSHPTFPRSSCTHNISQFTIDTQKKKVENV